MTTTASNEEIHDPVMGYWIRFERRGQNLIIKTRVQPGGGPPAHVHPNGDERFVVEQGQVEFLVGKDWVAAVPGDELVVPRGTKHAFKNVGSAEAIFKAELTPEPTGTGEGFFRETAAAARRGMYTRRGIPTGPRAALHLLGILERYQDLALICNPPLVLQRLLFPLARRLSG